jgi:hypothetical protein
MKSVSISIIISILVIGLTSCGAFAPKPTQTPIPTPTSLPTSTFTLEPTITPTPTEKPTQTPIPPTKPPTAGTLPMPTGKPVSNWEGIPVMPEAIAGEGDSKGYAFTIQATLDEVQTYYETEMSKLGWNILGTGQDKTNAVLLIFTKGPDIASFSIIPQPDGLMYVMLVR